MAAGEDGSLPSPTAAAANAAALKELQGAAAAAAAKLPGQGPLDIYMYLSVSYFESINDQNSTVNPPLHSPEGAQLKRP